MPDSVRRLVFGGPGAVLASTARQTWRASDRALRPIKFWCRLRPLRCGRRPAPAGLFRWSAVAVRPRCRSDTQAIQPRCLAATPVLAPDAGPLLGGDPMLSQIDAIDGGLVLGWPSDARPDSTPALIGLKCRRSRVAAWVTTPVRCSGRSSADVGADARWLAPHRCYRPLGCSTSAPRRPPAIPTPPSLRNNPSYSQLSSARAGRSGRPRSGIGACCLFRVARDRVARSGWSACRRAPVALDLRRSSCRRSDQEYVPAAPVRAAVVPCAHIACRPFVGVPT